VTRLVPAVVRALDLLELFLDDTRSLSVPEMASRLGLPRSTTHELVQTLVFRGYMSPVEGSPNRFTLGLRALELGSAYLANIDLARECWDVARAVSAKCDETVQVALLDGNEVVYIAKADSTQRLRLVSEVGRRLPAHLTAGGKALLSRLSDEEVLARYQHAQTLPGMTSNSITSMDKLLAELRQARRRGVAFDDCESNTDVRCVAAPVCDLEGKPVVGVSISVPAVRADHRRLTELAELVLCGAADLSRRLGYRAACAKAEACLDGASPITSGHIPAERPA